METCYKVFTAEALRSIPLESNRFASSLEIAAKVARNRFRTFEVPISYNVALTRKAKKSPGGMVWPRLFIFKYRFSPRYATLGRWLWMR